MLQSRNTSNSKIKEQDTYTLVEVVAVDAASICIGPAHDAKAYVPLQMLHAHDMLPAGSGSGDGSADSPPVVATPLFNDIQAVVSACKVEVDAAARAYYAAKDPARPAKYPARIPATAEELLAATDGVLDQLKQQLVEHVAAGTKELRLQVGLLSLQMCFGVHTAAVSMPYLRWNCALVAYYQ